MAESPKAAAKARTKDASASSGLSPFGPHPLRLFSYAIGLPALLIYVATSTLAIGGLVMMASEINRHDDERTTRVVHAALDSYLGALAEAVSDEGTWDEAYLRAVIEPDPAWLDTTWGSTARAGQTYDTVIITDAEGTIQFGENNLGALRGNVLTHFPAATAMLEALDRRITLEGDAATISAFAGSEGGIAGLAAISIHRSDPGEMTVPRDVRRVLWIGRHVSPAVLQGFAETFGVPPGRIVHEGAWQAAVPIGDIQNRLLGTLIWEPERPGDAALNRALLIASSLLFLIGLAMVFGLSWLRRALLRRAATTETALDTARRDPTTGHLSHFGLLDGLTSLLSKTAAPRQMTVAYMGVDNYERVRETHGADAAEELMQKIGKIIEHEAGRDALLGRVAQSAFAIGATGAKSQATVKRIAETVSERTGTPITIRDAALDPRLSIGISTGSGMRAPASLKSAEEAMREARAGGEERFVTYVMVDEGERRERVETTRRLRTAIKENQFELEYQPVFDLRGESLMGVEALLRWRRSDGTLEPPGFIASAEAAGLMSEIGLIALRRAAKDILPFKGLLLGFNVSASQFAHPAFAEQLNATLNAAGFPRSRLQLEMDQSLFAGQPHRTQGIIDELRTEGMVMALDDFVVGQSSLGYMRQFKLDRVKLARSLVAGIDTDATKLALVETTIRMARDAGLSITALGVERKEEVAKLLRLGCTEFQGFLFARPMTIEGLTRLVLAPERNSLRQAG